METQALGTPLETNKSVMSVLSDLLACQGKLIEGVCNRINPTRLIIDASDTVLYIST